MSVDPLLAGGPTRLGRYELLVPLARGGMGQVWVGRLRGARGFNKLVAIKTLLSMPDAEGRLEGMLFEEARIAALIHHANVVQTLELGEHENQLYLVMEWVDGESLSFILQRARTRGQIPLAIAAHWIGQTLQGLHAAHELTDDRGAPLGVVHRDVSPHNVLITYSGVAKLLDFGIAKAMNEATTFSGEVKGKLAYIAPEQLLCEGVDRRADLFAVGIMLYLLTTGRHPFKPSESAGVLQGLASDAPATRPSELVPGYPPLLDELVSKALEKNPERRFKTAEEMFMALRRAVPQAFEAGLDAQVKAFVRDVLGDRAAMRREALRRAQLAADSRSPVSEVPEGSSAQSGMRPVAVAVPAPTSQPTSREEALPPLLAPPRGRWRVPVLTGIGALVVLTAAGLGVRTLRPHSAPSAVVRPSVELAEVRASKPLREQPPTPPPPSPPEKSAVSAEALPTVKPTGEAHVRPTSTAMRPKGRKARRPPAGDTDLIKPDYAR